MISRSTSKGIVTVTDDTEIGDAERFMEESLDMILGKQGIPARDLCRQFGQELRLAETNYFALIHASKSIYTGKEDVEFLDGDKRSSLKRWLKAYDGKYGAVLADIPNPRNRAVCPKKSLLIMRYRCLHESLGKDKKAGPEAEFKLVTPFPFNAIIEIESKSHG